MLMIARILIHLHLRETALCKTCNMVLYLKYLAFVGIEMGPLYLDFYHPTTWLA